MEDGMSYLPPPNHAWTTCTIASIVPCPKCGGSKHLYQGFTGITKMYRPCKACAPKSQEEIDNIWRIYHEIMEATKF